MKIAILVSRFPPRWLAGTEIAAYHVARELARRGHEVHIITLWAKGLAEEEKREGFFIHRVRLPLPWLIPQIPLYFAKVLSTIRKIAPGIIHAQAISLNAGFGMGIRKTLRTPYVVWAQGSDVYLMPVWLKRLVSRCIIKNAAAVIGLTEHMRREIQSICSREVVVIPNGVETVSFGSLPRKQNQINDEQVVLFVGRLIAVKGVRYLIEAVNIITRQGKQSIKLVVIGDGPERGNLVSLVKELRLEERVEFKGLVPNQDIPEHMGAADIFALPSLSEGFPVTIVEAMAAGLPIVTSRICGLSEIVTEGENGFLVKPGDSGALAEKLLLLLVDEQMRRQISQNNRGKAKQYSWEAVVDKLERVYLQATIRRGSINSNR